MPSKPSRTLMFSDIMSAHKAVENYVFESPLLMSRALTNSTPHQEVMLKCENLQRAGSYHFRGMINKVIRAKEDDLATETFITHSTGNSGTALASAAKEFQAAAHVIVPEGTKDIITTSIEHYDGKFYSCPCNLEERKKNLLKLEANLKAQRVPTCVVHPYDDDDILAGFGTVGLELMEQTDCGVDCVVAAGGGGSLLAGLGVAVKGMKPHVKVFAAVPDDIRPDDAEQLFKRGEFPVRTESLIPRGHLQGCYRMTDNIHYLVEKTVDGVISVSRKQIRTAFRYVYERCKLVIDTNAATAVAAVLSCPPQLRKYRRVCIVISGGNVDLTDIPKIMAKL